MKLNRRRFLAFQFGIYVIIQAIMRLVFFLTSQHMASYQVGEVIKTFAVGLAYDVIVGFYYCLPLAIFLLLLPSRWLEKKKGRWPVCIVLLLMNLFLLFTAVSQFFFWNEFHTNFNFIAVDYLIYTTEIVGMIVQSRSMIIMVPVVAVLTILGTYIEMRVLSKEITPFSRKKRLAAMVAVLVIGCLLPQGIQDNWRYSVSNNNYNQEIAGNGPYCFVHAFFNNELNYDTFYKENDSAKSLIALRSMLQAPNSTYKSTTGISRYVNNTNNLTGRKPNIVLITVESFSSDYLGAFGAKQSSTPKLDQLAKESYIFTNMLATGTRTVRGLEAISLSMPPTPGQSILRRPDCDHQTTLGYVLDKDGYKSDFIYGGYGYFDNMNYFFETNGYTIKDRVSIPKEEIFNDTIWGVADEILFSQVLKSMDEHFTNQEPAFEMIMTTTNHRPWKFPEGRVDAPQGKREGGAAYTDWAIYNFIQQASKKPWFDNTVFVIVADHQADVAGRTALPVNRYRIPCIIYAPKMIQPGVNDRLISQMDLAPTLLGMLGISYDSVFMGRDINQVPVGQERAFISTYQSMGYIKGNQLVILGPRKDVTQYQIKDWMKSDYVQETTDPALTDEAITWYQEAFELYRDGQFKQQS